MMRDPTIIYPSSWYYNACVQGFMEVLAWGLGEKGVKNFFQDDGTIMIPSDLMAALFSAPNEEIPIPPEYNFKEIPSEMNNLKRIAWWWVEKSYFLGYLKSDDKGKNLSLFERPYSVIGRLCHFKNGFYPNLINPNLKPREEKIKQLNNWLSVNFNNDGGNVICSFCGSKHLEDKANVYDGFFTSSISRLFGSSLTEFPNAFWNGKPNLNMCTTCRTYFLFYHIVQKNKSFINSTSFKANWFLNHFIWNQVRDKKNKNMLTVIHYNSQLRKSLGSWFLQNIEFISFNYNNVELYSLNEKIIKLLLVPTVSTKLNRMPKIIWDSIMQEKFDYLPTIAYKSIKLFLTEKNPQNDPETVINPLYNNYNLDLLNDYIEMVFNIFVLIKHWNGGARLYNVNMKNIRAEAANGPLNLAKNADKNLVFRLLELTRANKKNEAFHLLMRLYLSRNQVFPQTLAQLFEVKDIEIFKTGLFAYIAGIKKVEINESTDQKQEGE